MPKGKIVLLALGVCALLTAGCVPEEPTPVQPAEQNAGDKATKKAKPPIGLKAKRATARHSVLSDGSPLSCVKVVVTNNSKKVVPVNPLYFALTDTGGIKHDAASAMGAYEQEIAALDLQPREKATGLVCARGSFRPKTVSMTNEMFSTAARAQVSG